MSTPDRALTPRHSTLEPAATVDTHTSLGRCAMPRKLADLFLYLYVWLDVALFMTAERINAVLPERKQ